MAAIDFDRVPTQVFYTVQRSFAPVCASLEYDRDTWKSGEAVRCGVWVINDLWEPVPEPRFDGEWLIHTVARAAEGSWLVTFGEDCAFKIGEAEWIAASAGSYELHGEVIDQRGKQLSENIFSFEVVGNRNVSYLGLFLILILILNLPFP
jgi:hypothetical protein